MGIIDLLKAIREHQRKNGLSFSLGKAKQIGGMMIELAIIEVKESCVYPGNKL